jgi:hypothetical protein
MARESLRNTSAQRRAGVLLGSILLTGLLGGCGTTRIITTSAQPSTRTASTSAEHRSLRIGDPATVTGQSSGEEIEATVTSYKDSLTTEIDKPSSGNRFVGVELKLKNVGSKPYSDAPSNGATLLTAAGRQAKGAIIGSGECSESFTASVKLAPSEAQEGCIAFEMPEGETAAKFQWTAASGFAGETAEWSLSGASSASAGGSAGGDASHPGLTKCDENISVNHVTSCPFAQRVFASFAAHIVTQGSTQVEAYSPVTEKSYPMNCSVSAETVECTGGKEAVVVFPLHAAQVYHH